LFRKFCFPFFDLIHSVISSFRRLSHLSFKIAMCRRFDAYDSFTISYRNKDNATRLYDTGVIFSSYIFNDRLPGGDNEYAIFGKINYTGFRDEGRKFGLQDKGVSLVTYKGKPYEYEAVSSAKMSIIIPVHFFDDIKIYNQNGDLITMPYTSDEPETVYINIHKSYFAFIPLEVTDFGTDIKMQVERAGDYILVSFYNYSGETRAFTEKELILLQNGFVCIAESGCNSMDEFVAITSDYVLKDVMEKQESAWFRKVMFKNNTTELNLMFSPLSEGIIVSTINKKPTGMHVVKADGLDLAKVPLL